jgi:hypothetical protein
MYLIENLNLSSFYGKTAVYQAYTLILLSVGFLEARFINQRIPAPRLTWYYDAFANHELKQCFLNWFDSFEENVRGIVAKSKEQIDYYLIHQEYIYVKKRVISTFLENERQALDGHFKQRAVNILNTVKNLENSNIKNKIGEIAEESLNSILTLVQDPAKNRDILDASFESALEGLKNGKMTYNGDKLLPLYIAEIKRRSEPLTKLSADEENKLFSLTQQQREYVISLDKRAKADYLNKIPDVNASVKNLKTFNDILNRMKNRVSANLKA